MTMDEIVYEKYFFHEKESKEECFSLLIYDIVDNKARGKFAKFMESYGKRVQKSAFEIRVNKKKTKEMMSRIQNYISDEDSVKLYRIHGNGEVFCWGTAKPEISDEVIIF